MDSTTKTIPTAAEQASLRFDHHRLDAFHVALEALVLGMAIANVLPRGNAKLGDQLARALQGAYLQTVEASARTGADRLARFRAARAEAGESAAVCEAVVRLSLVPVEKVTPVIVLLHRLCCMLTRLAYPKR